VRGISLKLQEEERERRMEFVPDRSEAETRPPGPGSWENDGQLVINQEIHQEILGRLLKTTHLISSHHFDDFLPDFLSF
jgi:hypothetical protein